MDLPANEGKMTCPDCGFKGIEIKVPERIIVNHDAFSMLVSPHEKGIRCPQCNTKFIPAIAQAEVLFGFARAANQTEEAIIIAPPITPHLIRSN